MLLLYERKEKVFKYLEGLIVPYIQTAWSEFVLDTKYPIYCVPASSNVEDVDMISFLTKRSICTRTDGYYKHFMPFYIAPYNPRKIEGLITEKSVSNVAFTDVCLFNVSLSLLLKTSTDKNGKFNFSNLPPGSYTIVAPDYSTSNYNSVIFSGIIL